jgi:transposase InsO family protein
LASTARVTWSWDITKLLGPAKWTYFYLYVVLDIFSRYVVPLKISLRAGTRTTCTSTSWTPWRIASSG